MYHAVVIIVQELMHFWVVWVEEVLPALLRARELDSGAIPVALGRPAFISFFIHYVEIEV